MLQVVPRLAAVTASVIEEADTVVTRPRSRMSVWGTRLTEKLISACVQPAGRAGPPAAAPAAASASEAIETLSSAFHTPRSSPFGVRRPSGACKGNVKRLQRPASRHYLTSESILNIGRYIAIRMIPTMIPTPINISGSMIEVRDWIDASTSSS